jgi:hypothetical protein
MKIFIYSFSLFLYELVWEVANMIRKIIIISIVCLMFWQGLPILVAPHTMKESGPEFEVGLATSISAHGPEISVKNIGDATAHNVTLIDLAIDGFVVYNNRVYNWRRDVKPGYTLFDYPNSLFIGFGIFTASITVTCDEGVTGNGSGNGIIVGPIIFVP